MFYSPSTKGFYDQAINGDNIPGDAVEITTERHAELLAGQSVGQQIVPDENGFPVFKIKTIDEIKETKVQEIKNAYEAILTTCSVSAGSEVFDIDISDKARSDWKDVYIGALSAGKVGVSIRDSNNITRVLTFEAFEFVLAQISSYLQVKWNRRCELIDEIRSESVTTLEEILSFEF